MSETTVNKQGYLLIKKNKIRMSNHIVVSSPSSYMVRFEICDHFDFSAFVSF